MPFLIKTSSKKKTIQPTTHQVQLGPETPDTNMTTLPNLKNSLQGRISDIEALCMSDLRNLKRGLRNRIHNANALLATMTTPAQSPAQMLMHVKYTKRIGDLTHEATTDLLDIEFRCRDDIDATEGNT